MDKEFDQRLAEIEVTLVDLAEQMRRINYSDRRQNRRIAAQQRYTMIFFAVMGLGALLGIGSLNPASRDSLEQVAIAVIVAGAGGLVGVNSGQFKPPEDGENED